MLRGSLTWPGAPLAILSAALFGASTPFAKLLLGGGVDPWMLAGLLYLGSGVGLGIVEIVRRAAGRASSEAPLRRGDFPWLALIVLSGGVVAPVLLMLGLAATPASTASLLLNLEGLATMAIAWLVFRENVDRRLLAGAGGDPRRRGPLVVAGRTRAGLAGAPRRSPAPASPGASTTI